VVAIFREQLRSLGEFVCGVAKIVSELDVSLPCHNISVDTSLAL
jgi:hypothetical protein